MADPRTSSTSTLPQPDVADLIDQVQFLRKDASFWANALPRFAADMQARADRYAIIAGILSAITGLSVWAELEKGDDPIGKVLVGLVGLTAAVVALIPKTFGYSECGTNAFDVAAAYGHAEGELVKAYHKLRTNDADAEEFAETARKTFEEVRARKEKLHPYPARLQAERQRVVPDPYQPGGLAVLPLA